MMNHLTRLTSTLTLGASLIFGLSGLVSCASAPPSPQAQQAETQHTLIVYPTLDLTSRQEPNRAWLSALISLTNPLISPLKVQLKLGEGRPWELSDRMKNEPLERLWAGLLRDLPAPTAQTEALPPLWLAINSFPPPSYPKLSQLAFARHGAPLIMIRQLRLLSGLNERQALLAMSRLLARSIGVSLGALQGCEEDTLSLKRDELLGWRLNSEPSAGPPRPAYDAPPGRHPRQGRPSVSPPAHERSGRELSSAQPPELTLTPLSWSKLNLRLTAITLRGGLLSLSAAQASGEAHRAPAYCERLETLELSCKETLEQARLYTHACLMSAEAWADRLKLDKLPAQWEDERQLAEGAQALIKGSWEEALKRCAPIASYLPSSFASQCAGRAAMELKRDDEAQRYLRAHLAAHPLNPEDVLLLSKVIGRNGEHRAAEALLEELLDSQEVLLNPLERGRALYNLGVARAQLGRLEEALEVWRRIKQSGGPYYDKARELIEESGAQ